MYIDHLINTLRNLLLDTSDLSLSDAMAIYFLNESQTRFATDTLCCQQVYSAEVTGSLTFDTIEGAASPAVLAITEIVRVEVPNYSQPVLTRTPLTSGRLIHYPTSGTLSAYSVFGRTIYFDESIAKTMKVWYAYTPTIISVSAAIASTVLGVPAQFWPGVYKYMKYLAYLQTRDAGLANGAYAEYEAYRVQAALLVKAQVE